MFGAWAFEKEEAWLNEMSKKGYQLTDVKFLKYIFEEKEEAHYIYRIQMLENNQTREDREDYIGFVEETGAEYVASYFNWVYFRKVYDDKGFELFSDIDSRIKHLNQNILILGLLGLINVINGFNILHRNLALNITAGLCLGVGALLLFASGRIYLRRHALEKDRAVHE